MGFYIQTLREDEEFMGNTGFDDNLIGQSGGEYAAELNDIAQTIEDINTDYADQSSQDELDGQDLADNPVEECVIALAECEYNWNEIWKAIGTKELHEAAIGKPSIMTENAVTDFFKAVKDFFVKMFKKITAIVKNWIDNATAKFRTTNSFLNKYGESTLNEGKAAFEKAGKSFKGYNFNRNDISAFKNRLNINKTVIEDEKKFFTELNKSVDMDDESKANLAKKEMDMNLFRATLVGGENSVTESEFAKKLKLKLYGSEDKVELNKNSDAMSVKNIISSLSKYKDDIKSAKKTYSAIDKLFKSTINLCGDLEKAIKKYDTKGDESKISNQTTILNSARKVTASMKSRRAALSIAYNTWLKAIKAEKSQSRKIANAYIYSLNKSNRKNESARLNSYSTSFFSNIQMR